MSVAAPALRGLLKELAGRERHSPRDDIVRLAVRLRARDACEYCLMPTTGPFHVEHVIPPALWDEYAAGRIHEAQPVPARGGPDHIDNYAWCCPFCNLAKRQQVIQRVGHQSVRLFDPRRDRWPEHFLFAPGHLIIVGLSQIGRATEEALVFNEGGGERRLSVAIEMARVGHYPPRWARPWVLSEERAG